MRMRFKLRGNRMMYKGILILSLLAIQNVKSETTDGLKTFRLKTKQFSSPLPSSTTPTPIIPPTSLVSHRSLQTGEKVTPKQAGPNGGRRRVRVKRIKVSKRQGEFSESENTNGVREPLYEEHQDEINVPDHYYSPIRRQRMKGNKQRLFKQGIQHVHEQFHQSLEESPSNPNIDFTRKRNRERRPRPEPINREYQRNINQNDHSEEFVASTPQPPPKNYAFAYAVENFDGDTEDFSHKEARDGKLTMGEYRTALPDGRTQIVRYTAGGNIGYKADVTYEGNEASRNDELLKKPQPIPISSPKEQSYFPPGLSKMVTTSPTYRPKIKKYRNKSVLKYGSPTSSPPFSFKEREGPQFKYTSPRASPPPVYKDLDKYDSSPDYYSPQPQPSPTPSSSPKQSYGGPKSNYYEDYPLTPTSSSIHYNGESQREKRPRKRPQFDVDHRPRPKKTYETIPAEEKKEYKGNLEFLHDQSPRAGPTRQKKKSPGGSFNDEGKYNYPGHQELEDEIATLKKSYRPQFELSDYKQQSKRFRKPFPSVKPTEEGPADLYNEPGPGNYYSSVNGPPSSPAPVEAPRVPKYPKPVYKSPSPKPAFNYIDHYDDHNSHEIDYHENKRSPPPQPQSFGSYTPINFKSGKGKELIPIDDFKAGPARRKFRKKPEQTKQGQDIYGSPPRRPPGPTPTPESVRYKDPFHYYNSQHPSFHHGGYTPPQPPAGLLQDPLSEDLNLNPTPATENSYTIDFPGGKHSFYLKTGSGSVSKPKSTSPYKKYNPQSQSQSPHYGSQSLKGGKKHSSGLVYFETPGTGPRPTQLGVEGILSQLPNMRQRQPSTQDREPQPHSHTTIHPYEVGAKDYGQSVGYKNSFNTPSSGEHSADNNNQHENHDDHDGSNYPRDYLIDNNSDRIIPPRKKASYKLRLRPSPSPLTPSSTPPPIFHIQQYHYQKAPSPSPEAYQDIGYQQNLQPQPLESPFSTPETYQDINYEQNLQLQPLPSPTPPVSTSYFIQPIKSSRQEFPSRDFLVDPRNAGGAPSSSPNEEPLNFVQGGQHEQPVSDPGYQYQYEDGSVK